MEDKLSVDVVISCHISGGSGIIVRWIYFFHWTLNCRLCCILLLAVADKRRCLWWSVWIRIDKWDNATAPTAVPTVCSHKLGSRRQCGKVRPGAAAVGCHILHGQRTGWSTISDAKGAAIYGESEEQRPRREGTCRLHYEPRCWQQICFYFQVSIQ